MIKGREVLDLAVVASERVFGGTCSVEASVKKAGVKGSHCASQVCPVLPATSSQIPNCLNIPSDGLPVSQYRDLNSAGHKSACAAKPESVEQNEPSRVIGGHSGVNGQPIARLNVQDGSSVCGKKGAEASTQSIRKLALLACPNGCKTGKIYRDGLRYNQDGSETQRWLCTACGVRFSPPKQDDLSKSLNTPGALPSNRQICAGEAKNLHVLKGKCIGTGEITAEARAAITVFEGWLKTQGYKKNRYPNNLVTLLHLGADLMNPEDVKAKIGAHPVRDGMKMMLCYSYEAFLSMNEMAWKRPEYKQDEIIPFIPEESELDVLIAAAQSRRMTAYLQTLKETFTDPGEALPIERQRDIVGNLITIRHPVKNHRPRTLEVSDKLIAMINMVSRDSERVFDCKYSVMCNSFIELKRRVAARTHNDRLNYVELRSFRHWGGTKIAELSNGNPITVMKLLGLKSVENAMKYVNIWKLSFRTETEFEYLAVTTPEELKVALLGGYQLVIEKFGASWFRRPKRIAIAGVPVSLRPDEPQCPPLETPINKRKGECINAYSPVLGDVSRASDPQRVAPSFFVVFTVCLVLIVNLEVTS